MGAIRVLVIGASGKMGREVVRAIVNDAELELVGAVDRMHVGKDAGLIAGIEPLNVFIREDLAAALQADKPQVVVDFTAPASIMNNLHLVIAARLHAVVGTTGLSRENLREIEELCHDSGVNVLVAPNFAIGALLMMRFAAQAAKFFPHVEIIELHHDQKLDAPSGTSIKTAELILAGQNEPANACVGEEKLPGARGGEMGGIRLHSVRLPGLIAHQEVIFGGEGQTLTIRHDSLSRESFMPGVVLAIKKIGSRPGLTYGLEELLF
ncbi:dihydrodipicolinate reductase [Hydrogenispora ethanolica]|uniref:4-hydroxy-tetrahydrodipicolinate reductase n=1 Tax=Hydrogenispora ethanolica TaxID=1082276 RepID=A0A4R1R820_HYDET|nr:4-hydroxy-tetrahydrodipicolinate reductase [Hydrogenispora ethanolica]TCL61795.1 dihydrodipicolinate reductase [Hydrogenispora ethanolica]